MMRATTIKAAAGELTRVIGYYAGLAEDQLTRDGMSRGPVDYYVDWDRSSAAIDEATRIARRLAEASESSSAETQGTIAVALAEENLRQTRDFEVASGLVQVST